MPYSTNIGRYMYCTASTHYNKQVLAMYIASVDCASQGQLYQQTMFLFWQIRHRVWIVVYFHTSYNTVYVQTRPPKWWWCGWEIYGMINDFHMFQSLTLTAIIYWLFGKTIFLANICCPSGSSVRSVQWALGKQIWSRHITTISLGTTPSPNTSFITHNT